MREWDRMRFTHEFILITPILPLFSTSPIPSPLLHPSTPSLLHFTSLSPHSLLSSLSLHPLTPHSFTSHPSPLIPSPLLHLSTPSPLTPSLHIPLPSFPPLFLIPPPPHAHSSLFPPSSPLSREALQLPTLHYIIRLMASYYDSMVVEKKRVQDARQWGQR